MRFVLNKILAILIGVVIVGAIVFSILPGPVGIDLAQVTRGPLVVTVDEDGRTRIKERYTVSSPLAGRIQRIELHPGDEVEAGKTILATIEPTDPGLLDPRALAQAEARVRASEAAYKQATSNLERARVASEYAKADIDRAKQLVQRGIISHQELDNAELKERVAGEELKATQFAVQVSKFELELAKAALLRMEPNSIKDLENWRLQIHSPVNGQVLRVYQESATTVSSGTQLLELGNPAELEIEIDVLSNDAVKIKPGAKVILEDWGGDEPLIAQVRLIEPQAFTKVSALGVEEQRVYIVADFVDPLEKWKSLGDNYRVESRIIIWERENALKIPTGALFRKGDEWAVFLDENGKARLRTVKAGNNNGLESEVLEGLKEGDQVILYPSDRIKDGVDVTPR